LGDEDDIDVEAMVDVCIEGMKDGRNVRSDEGWRVGTTVHVGTGEGCITY